MNMLSSDKVASILAFNSFADMLYSALKAGIPGCLLSTTASYWWKGYRIDSYRNLATNQFYCLVYTDDLDTLVFKGAYRDDGYKYPWEGNPNLQLSRINFFDMDIDEQKNNLREFIESASEQALIWQNSAERNNKVPNEFIQGKKTKRNPRKEVAVYRRVTKNYSKAIKLQNQIFDILNFSIHNQVEKQLFRKVKLFPNSSWYN